MGAPAHSLGRLREPRLVCGPSGHALLERDLRRRAGGRAVRLRLRPRAGGQVPAGRERRGPRRGGLARLDEHEGRPDQGQLPRDAALPRARPRRAPRGDARKGRRGQRAGAGRGAHHQRDRTGGGSRGVEHPHGDRPADPRQGRPVRARRDGAGGGEDARALRGQRRAGDPRRDAGGRGRGGRGAPAPARTARRVVGARRRRCRLGRGLCRGPVAAVKAADFDYYRVDSLEDAIERLRELGEDAKVLAGGHRLRPLMNFRPARPAALVDITRVEELRGISRGNGELRIRAATTHAEVEHAAELEGGYEVMRAAARWVGHEPIRSRGTFGGSLAHADPTAEWCLIAVALGAVIEIAGPGGEREVPAEDFLLGYFTTALEPDEIVTAVRFPAPCRRAAVQELARRHGDFALVAVAAALPEDGEPRIVLGGVGDVPLRAREAERLLAAGEPPEAAAQAAAEEIEPGHDLHASPDYRRRLARTLVRRAVEEAAEHGS